jgi:RNA polymerase sigma factor (sigma-70 family)
MSNLAKRSNFETALAGERARLVRLCAWFTGSREAAEDLAQETLAAAWKNQAQLLSPDKLQPWTSAIARNICLNWSRGDRHERSRIVGSMDAPGSSLEDSLADDLDLELELDRQELAALLDRALSLLPPETGQMLIEHYIRESSHAEIAAKMKIKPGTVAVRLQRGKLTLQKYLRKNQNDKALAFGLITGASAEWEETNIWCLSCGASRLLGRFRKHESFALRCPQCDPQPHRIMAGMDLTQPYYDNLLGSIKTYKPAYSRLITALSPLYRQALQSRTTPCPACGQALTIRITAHIKAHGAQQIKLYCTACDWASNKTLSSLVMGLPAAQRFWRAYPRLKILPDQQLDFQGTPALLTRIQSVTGSAELYVISKRDTFEPLEVHTNVSF